VTGPYPTRRRVLAGLVTAAGAMIAQSALGRLRQPQLVRRAGRDRIGHPERRHREVAQADRARGRASAVSAGRPIRFGTRRRSNPFTAVSGARVVDAPWDYGKFVNMIASPAPEWDLIDFDGYAVAGLIMAGKATGKLADWVRRV